PGGHSDGSSIAEWRVSDEREWAGLSRSWGAGGRSAASLHIRAFCPRHQSRYAAGQRSLRDAHKRDEIDSRTRPRESRLYGLVPSPAMIELSFRGAQNRGPRHVPVLHVLGW